MTLHCKKGNIDIVISDCFWYLEDKLIALADRYNGECIVSIPLKGSNTVHLTCTIGLKGNYVVLFMVRGFIKTRMIEVQSSILENKGDGFVVPVAMVLPPTKTIKEEECEQWIKLLEAHIKKGKEEDYGERFNSAVDTDDDVE